MAHTLGDAYDEVEEFFRDRVKNLPQQRIKRTLIDERDHLHRVYTFGTTITPEDMTWTTGTDAARLVYDAATNLTRWRAKPISINDGTTKWVKVSDRELYARRIDSDDTDSHGDRVYDIAESGQQIVLAVALAASTAFTIVHYARPADLSDYAGDLELPEDYERLPAVRAIIRLYDWALTQPGTTLTIAKGARSLQQIIDDKNDMEHLLQFEKLMERGVKRRLELPTIARNMTDQMGYRRKHMRGL